MRNYDLASRVVAIGYYCAKLRSMQWFSAECVVAFSIWNFATTNL